ncbi:MAG: hypothetical protein ACFFD1_12775, partial [Candidatus Thorarchaeota archaeon]
STIKADSTPVAQIGQQQEIFYPTTNGNISSYIIDPNFAGPDAVYHGDNAGVARTSIDTNGNSITNDGTTINNGNTITGSSPSLSPQTRNTANPLLDDESLPRFVNISAGDVNLTSSFVNSISLHLDQSFTFFLNHSLTYDVFYNISDPFLLDVYVLNPSTNGVLDLTSTLFPGVNNYPISDKLTIPIYPETTPKQMFTIKTTNTFQPNSLVTLTPHLLTVKSTSPETVAVNQFYSGSIEQGSCVNTQNTTLANQNLKLMSLKTFNFPVESGKAYQIYFYSNNIYDYMSGCGTSNLVALQTDRPGSYGFASGNIDDTGRFVQVAGANSLNVTMIAYGAVFKDYSFYMQEAEKITVPQDKPLPFGVNVTLQDGLFYNFTLTQPSMIAINRSTSGSLSFSLDWFKWDTDLQDWSASLLSYTQGTGTSIIETGNLLGGGGTIDRNWLYFPAGTYRIEVAGNTNLANIEFFFTKVPVTTFSGSVDLQINNGGIYAVNLPFEMNKLNYVNISTIIQNNLSVSYDYAFIGKYNYFTTTYDTFSSSEGQTTNVGNREVNGEWVSFNPGTNESTIFGSGDTFLKSRPHQDVILIIRPYSAVNTTGDPQYPFSTSLTVTSFTKDNNYPSISIGNYGTGNFIPMNSISTSSTFPFNDDLVDQSDIVYGIPLTIDPNSVYTVNVTLIGNYSATNKNASFVNMFIHGGNLYNLLISGQSFQGSSNTTFFRAQSILTISSTSYLHLNIHRTTESANVYRNGTINISLTKLNIQKIDLANLNLLNTWNGTVSNIEVPNSEPLWSVVGFEAPSGADLFLPLLVLGGLGVAVLVVGGFLVFRGRGEGSFGKRP